MELPPEMYWCYLGPPFLGRHKKCWPVNKQEFKNHMEKQATPAANEILKEYDRLGWFLDPGCEGFSEEMNRVFDDLRWFYTP